MTMISGIQLIGAFFCLGFIFFIYTQFKKDVLSKGDFFFWGLPWAIIFLLFLYPAPLKHIIGPLEIVRVFDLVTALAVMFLFSFAFHNTLLHRKTKRKLEKLVRKTALQEK